MLNTEVELGKEVNVAAVGDSMITMRLSHYCEKRYLDMVKIIRDADVAFMNVEGMIHNYEGYLYKPWSIGTPMRAPPFTGEEIKWMGFNLVATANNHSMDYSEESMLAMFRALDAAGIPHAGMGRDLASARRPAYLWTKKGRVGLISISTAPLGSLYIMAGHTAQGVRGRPGMNGLRFSTTYVVDNRTMDEMKKIVSLLKMKPPVQDATEIPLKEKIGDDELLFLGKRFRAGEKPGVYCTANEDDVEANLREIRGARKQADWVLVSLHFHEGPATRVSPSGDEDMPAEFVRKFEQDCIDAGADAVISHGHHPGRGVEIYKGKPIFHSLGTFIMQTSCLPRIPADAFEKYGIDPSTATRADWNDMRWKLWWTFLPDPWNYKAVIARFTISDGELTELKLYPVDDGGGGKKPRWHRARPMLSDERTGKEIIERYQNLSAPFGTEIEYKDGVGVVKL